MMRKKTLMTSMILMRKRKGNNRGIGFFCYENSGALLQAVFRAQPSFLFLDENEEECFQGKSA